MPIKKQRRCPVDGNPIGEYAPPNKRYCSKDCVNKAYRLRKRAKELKSRKAKGHTTLTPAMREFRALMDEKDPFIREALQQAIRDSVTEVVADNLVGAGEILTGMLPKTLAGLAVDLESSDWMIRSRAQQMVMKYAMEFKKTDAKDGDLGQITVTHNVAIPGTPLGRATAGEIETLEAKENDTIIEYFERDWPQCLKCLDRKHPDAMTEVDGELWCSSCRLTATLRKEDIVDGVAKI